MKRTNLPLFAAVAAVVLGVAGYFVRRPGERHIEVHPPLTIPEGPKVDDPACAGDPPPLCAGAACAPMLRCPKRAVLWGQIIDATADAWPFPGIAGGTVAAWYPGQEDRALVVEADAAGVFGFLVPTERPIFYEGRRQGFYSELHAASVPGGGFRMDLDMRTPEALSQIFSRTPNKVLDPRKGIVAIELIDAVGGGEGATLEPRGDPPVVIDAPFNKDWNLVESDKMIPGGEQLVLYTNVPVGESRIAYFAQAGTTCTARAPGVERWPIRAGVVTQVDAVCTH
jgi:hypothetical protein